MTVRELPPPVAAGEALDKAIAAYLDGSEDPTPFLRAVEEFHAYTEQAREQERAELLDRIGQLESRIKALEEAAQIGPAIVTRHAQVRSGQRLGDPKAAVEACRQITSGAPILERRKDGTEFRLVYVNSQFCIAVWKPADRVVATIMPAYTKPDAIKRHGKVARKIARRTARRAAIHD